MRYRRRNYSVCVLLTDALESRNIADVPDTQQPMPSARMTLGQRGETLAAQYLVGQGYTIVERNWRCPRGELDIVAHDGAEWIFVEVRTRRAPDINSALESFTNSKQQHILAAAENYLAAHHLEEVSWRIDLAVVALTPRGPQNEVIRDAPGW
jgi:putative endonuclease